MNVKKLLAIGLFSLSLKPVITAQVSRFVQSVDTLNGINYSTNSGTVSLGTEDAIKVWQNFVAKYDALIVQSSSNFFVWNANGVAIKEMGGIRFNTSFKCTPLTDTSVFIGLYSDDQIANNPGYSLFLSGLETDYREKEIERVNAQLKVEINQLEKDKKAIEKDVKKINKDISKTETQIKKEEGVIAENNDAIKRNEKNIAENIAEIDGLQKSIANFDEKGKGSEIKSLKKSSKKLIKSNSKQKKEIGKNEKTMTGIEQKIDVNNKLAIQIRDQAEKTAAIEALKSEANKMEKKANNLDKSNEKLNYKFDKLTAENKQATTNIADNILLISTNDQRRDVLTKEITNFEKKVKDKKIKSLAKSNKKLTKQSEKLEKKIGDKKAEVQQNEAEKADLENAADEKKSNIGDKKEKISKKKQKVKSN